MEDTINQSFTEVYNIINHFEEELYNKIPKKFINLIEQNMDNTYNSNIDFTKSINDQELLHETRVILSLIYRDYLCSEEEREALIQKDKIELAKYEEELREKYNPDNIFKNRQPTVLKEEETLEETVEETSMVEYKESFVKKIFNKIKSIFKK